MAGIVQSLRELPKPWRQALILAVAVLLGVVVWGIWLRATAPVAAALPARLAMPSIGVPWQPMAIEVEGDRRIDLVGDMARFVVVPSDTSVELALASLLGGAGQPFGHGLELAAEPALPGPSSLYALFAYRTRGTEPGFLRYRLMSTLLAAIWVEDASGREFRLVGLGGAAAPGHAVFAQGGGVTVSMMPTAILPATPEARRLVLVRLDSVFPYWSNFSLSTQHGFMQYRVARNYFDGVFLGAMITAMAFAVYGLYRRQVVDYLTFLLAAAALSAWYLVLREHASGTDSAIVRRMALVLPVYAYFLLHGFGVWRLLYPPRPHMRQASKTWRVAPLGLAAAFCLLGLFGNGLYGLAGVATPAPAWLNMLNESVLAVVPPLLLLTTVLAPRPRLPGYAPLLAAELVGAGGAALQWLRINTPWLDGAILDSLTQYPLPIEVLIWAVALNSRFNYLEMIAKRRVKAALRREAARVRESLAEGMRSRERALDALERSYTQLDRTRQAMQDIVGTHAHAARGLLFRLGAQLGQASGSGAAHRSAAVEELIDELAESVNRAELAVEESGMLEHAAASAASLLRWHIDARGEELAMRGVAIRLRIAAMAENALVDGYHFMELARELVANLARYAQGGSIAAIELDRIGNTLCLSVRNRGVLREDTEALRLGRPVTPAASTLNGEQSSGRGLSRLADLLADGGGALRCECEAPDRFVVVATLPLRGVHGD